MMAHLKDAVFGVILAAFAPQPSLADGADEARAILDRHNAAFAAGDVDAMLADYAQDAIFIGPTGVLRGHAEIGEFFAAVMAEFAKPGASFAVNQTEFADNVAYFAWQAETADNVYETRGRYPRHRGREDRDADPDGEGHAETVTESARLRRRPTRTPPDGSSVRCACPGRSVVRRLYGWRPHPCF